MWVLVSMLSLKTAGRVARYLQASNRLGKGWNFATWSVKGTSRWCTCSWWDLKVCGEHRSCWFLAPHIGCPERELNYGVQCDSHCDTELQRVWTLDWIPSEPPENLHLVGQKLSSKEKVSASEQQFCDSNMAGNVIFKVTLSILMP